MRLGKQAAKPDNRTMRLGNFMRAPYTPYRYNYDSRKAPFPLEMWGNDKWGNCVMVGQAHDLIRKERKEQRVTLPLNEEIIVAHYKQEVGRQFGVQPASPGDNEDTGLVVLDALKSWRSNGWTLTERGVLRDHQIQAFGSLNPHDKRQLKSAIYLLGGIHYGFWLPAAASDMLASGKWDYNGETGPEWEPGSWGGHLVFGKAYNRDWFEVITWGRKVVVSHNFIARYCDEAYATVDAVDGWLRRSWLDLEGMVEYLRLVGASNSEWVTL